MTFRGFVAVDIPPTPALTEFVLQMRKASASLNVVSTDHLHLTLKFLGDTEEGLVPEIATAIRESAAGTRPFEVRVRGTGAFPSPARMNVVWVGVDGAERLARIAAALDASLETLGFARDNRPWKPHVTVARVKGRRDLDPVRSIVSGYAETVFGTHRVDSIHLKRSVLTPTGAQYSIVESVRLGPFRTGGDGVHTSK